MKYNIRDNKGRFTKIQHTELTIAHFIILPFILFFYGIYRLVILLARTVWDLIKYLYQVQVSIMKEKDQPIIHNGKLIGYLGDSIEREDNIVFDICISLATVFVIVMAIYFI